MRWLAVIATVFWISLPSVRVYGEELQLHPKVVVVDGKKGLWFSEVESARMLERLEKTKAQEELVRAQDELIRTQKTTIQTATKTIDLQLQLHAETALQLTETASVAHAAFVRADAAEASRDAWYRSPPLWYLGGVLTTVITLTAVTIITK